MNADRPQLTPDQARDQLGGRDSRSLRSTHDRRIHALGTVVFGLNVGAWAATQNAFDGVSRFVMAAIFMVIFIAVTIWTERAARTVPRRARLWSRLGFAASLILGLFAVLPWLNVQAQTEPNTWPMLLVAALIISTPSLLAAAVIARARR